jgi:hypothetical protein
MIGDLIPMVIMTGMFAMIFGITYIRSRENMAMIEKGLNPRNKDPRPRPYINLKWGLLLIGAGMGLLLAFIIDNTILKDDKAVSQTSITIGSHHSKGQSKTSTIDTSHFPNDTSLAARSAAKNDDPADDDEDIEEIRHNDPKNVPIYFALIAIGGGLGLFFSYRIEKKEWVDKKMDA